MRRIITIGLLGMALMVTAASFAPGPAEDGGTTRKDGGTGEDGSTPQCVSSGQSCDGTHTCCSGLTCTDGVCAGSVTCAERDGQCNETTSCCEGLYCNAGFCDPACTGDDTTAGTMASPVPLTSVADGATQMHACTAQDFWDVFSLSAAMNDLLRIKMNIVGGDPAGDSDLDIYLVKTGETATSCPGSWDAELCFVGAGASTSAVESINMGVSEAAFAGDYLLIVQGYAGAQGDYTLEFEKGQVCKTDGDCSSGFCYTGITDGEYMATSECATWAAPACGQDGPEGTAHSFATAVGFDSVATDGTVVGKICGDDVDVFTITLNDNESLVGTFSVANALPMDTLLGMLVMNADAEVVYSAVLANSAEGEVHTADVAHLYNEGTATYYVVVDFAGTNGSPSATLDYTLKLDKSMPCRTDAECSPPATYCGVGTTGNILFICAPAKADGCEGQSDTDNTFAMATLLTSGTAVSTEVACMGHPDFYKVTATAPLNNLSATVTWIGDSDVDIMMVAADGTIMGAGWYGENTETVKADSVPAGDYYLVVDVYSGTGNISYVVTATVAAGVACTSDAGCKTGGITAEDFTRQYQCNSESGACERPFPASSMGVANGGGCFESLDCGSMACFSQVCSVLCNDTGAAECTAAFGANSGKVYCMDEYVDMGADAYCTPFCAEPGSPDYYWDQADCVAFFGEGATCDNTTHKCVAGN